MDSSVQGIKDFSAVVERFTPDLQTTLSIGERESKYRTLCKRKGVCCSVIRVERVGLELEIFPVAEFYNGPLHDIRERCTGVTGGCGCLHSEPKAALAIAALPEAKKGSGLILATTYSPCLPCAQVVAMTGSVGAWVYRYFAPHHPTALEFLSSAGIHVREI